jgi:hypothetical protein
LFGSCLSPCRDRQRSHYDLISENE